MSFSAESIRYQLLSGHYRTKILFSFNKKHESDKIIRRVTDFYFLLDKNKPIKSLGNSLPDIYLEFKKAMNDDLNTPRALGIFFDWMKTESKKIKDNLAGEKEILSAWNFLKVFNSIFDFVELNQVEVPENIAAMLESRKKARRNKDWALSDKIRKSILGEGWLVEDTLDGQKLKKPS